MSERPCEWMPDYAPDLALTGGRWVGDRGVMRWVPNETKTAKEVDDE